MKVANHEHIPSLGRIIGVQPEAYVLVDVVVGFAHIWRGVTRGGSSPMVQTICRLDSAAAIQTIEGSARPSLGI